MKTAETRVVSKHGLSQVLAKCPECEKVHSVYANTPEEWKLILRGMEHTCECGEVYEVKR